MRIKIENVRLSFPALFKAEAFKPGDEPKYKATFLIEKDSETDKAIEKAILETAKFKWGAKAEKTIQQIRSNPNKFCYQDGDNKSFDGYEGMMALSAKNGTKPLVIDRNRTVLDSTDGKPYAGCYVNASIEIFCYDNSGAGISASLGGVQFVRDGDAFAGGKASDVDEFDELEAGADADDLV